MLPATQSERTVLFIFHFKKTISISPQTIGICGISNGSGTTHLSLAFSNYICSRWQQKTAYSEINQHDEVSCFSTVEHNHSFSYMGIDFYPNEIPEHLPNIKKGGYSYLIIDFGVLNDGNYSNFLQCDYKFLLGMTSPWKIHQYDEVIEFLQYKSEYQANVGLKNIQILSNMGIKEHLGYFRKHYHISIEIVPFIPNPFQLEPANWTFFENLLKRN